MDKFHTGSINHSVSASYLNIGRSVDHSAVLCCAMLLQILSYSTGWLLKEASYIHLFDQFCTHFTLPSQFSKGNLLILVSVIEFMNYESFPHEKRRNGFVFYQILFIKHAVYVCKILSPNFTINIAPFPLLFIFSELERQRYSVLIVCHLAVLRCIYAYFMDIKVNNTIIMFVETVADVFSDFIILRISYILGTHWIDNLLQLLCKFTLECNSLSSW